MSKPSNHTLESLIMKKKFALFFLYTALSICFLSCSKEDDVHTPGTIFTSGGIYFKVTSSAPLTIAVTYTPNNSYGYSGTIRIPDLVNYHDVSYSVTSIGVCAFEDCDGLTSVAIPNSVISIETNAFSGCSELKNITIGSSLKSIGDYAFNHCTSMTSITIPSSVTSIGYSAFEGCTSLTSITIPFSVTKIGDSAFSMCYNLNTFYSYPTVPVDANSLRCVFYGVNTATCVLHVPVGAKRLYSAADGWKSFRYIVEDIPISNN